jgi:hypothetical protein
MFSPAGVRIEHSVLFMKRRVAMFYILAFFMIILWFLGLVTSYTLGGFIHIMLALAIAFILLQFIGGRKATRPHF